MMSKSFYVLYTTIGILILWFFIFTKNKNESNISLTYNAKNPIKEPQNNRAGNDFSISKISTASQLLPIQNRASTNLEKLQGESQFASYDGSTSAVNPIYHYKGLEVEVKGEGISCPVFSLKGGRGELVFGLVQYKPMTSKTVGELFIERGKLQFKERLDVTYYRGPQFAYVLDKTEKDSLQKFGIAWAGEPMELEYEDSIGNILPKPRRTFKSSIYLLQEHEVIGQESIDAIIPKQFSPNWIGIDPAGKLLNLYGKSVRIIWFSFDQSTGKLKKNNPIE